MREKSYQWAKWVVFGCICVGVLVWFGRAWLYEGTVVVPGTFVSKQPFRAVQKAQAPQRKEQRYVIAMSIDGLRSDAIERLGASQLPHLFSIMREGASTLNARTDADITVTLPNHTCMLTGRRAEGPKGHGYGKNRMPHSTIHQNKGQYVPSIFGHLHDRGFRTGLFASKRKFILFPISYGAKHGAPDLIAPDHGRNKIDLYAIASQDKRTVRSVLEALKHEPPHFMFVHFRSPDTYGHSYRWMSASYLQAVRKADAFVGRVLQAIKTNETLRHRTVLAITTDHGGSGFNHRDPRRLEHYRIPFLVWGAGVGAGQDLYKLNASSHEDPKQKQPLYNAPKPPIRNCDIANLVASLFAVHPLKGSMIGASHPIRLR